MSIQSTTFPDVLAFFPRVHHDERGFFFESFNAQDFTVQTGLDCAFVQDNHSSSGQGVVRGLHYQLPPHAQGKLVRVIYGEVYDVVVDIRRSSPTFGRWAGYLLSAENKTQLWIPPGFAHGFLTLSDRAEFLYKTTSFYDQASERCILWNDPTLAIDWPWKKDPILSDKDAQGVPFLTAEIFA